jgi:hypothetical protein
MSQTKEEITKELATATTNLEIVMAAMKTMAVGPGTDMDKFLSVIQPLMEKRDDLRKIIETLNEKLKEFS